MSELDERIKNLETKVRNLEIIMSNKKNNMEIVDRVRHSFVEKTTGRRLTIRLNNLTGDFIDRMTLTSAKNIVSYTLCIQNACVDVKCDETKNNVSIPAILPARFCKYTVNELLVDFDGDDTSETEVSVEYDELIIRKYENGYFPKCQCVSECSCEGFVLDFLGLNSINVGRNGNVFWGYLNRLHCLETKYVY